MGCCGIHKYIVLYTIYFCGVKHLWITSFHNFCIFILQTMHFCNFAFVLYSQPLPLRRKNLLRSGTSGRLGTQNERMGILKLSIYTRTRRNDPVTAHMWTYKRILRSFRILSSAWHQRRLIICTGISSCISMVLIRQAYRANVAIFAICNVTANQLV